MRVVLGGEVGRPRHNRVVGFGVGLRPAVLPTVGLRYGTPMERYRIFSDGATYFITMSIVDWLPVFLSDLPCRIITDSLNFCRIARCINAYVIMPTHLHVIVFRESFDPELLKSTLTDFRKFTARKLIEYCAQSMPACYDRVFLASGGSDRSRRFWQPTLHPERIRDRTLLDSEA